MCVDPKKCPPESVNLTWQTFSEPWGGSITVSLRFSSTCQHGTYREWHSLYDARSVAEVPLVMARLWSELCGATGLRASVGPSVGFVTGSSGIFGEC